MRLRVGVIGASGFAGAEYLRLASTHPLLEIAWATASTQVGQSIGDLYPHLAGCFPSEVFVSFDPRLLDDVDAVVLAMPHGAGQTMMADLVAGVRWVVDLSSDFRLPHADDYTRWYGEARSDPSLLGSFVYGLPELYRDEIRSAERVAAPGCYATAGILGVEPLVRKGLVSPHRVIVDAASGVSGAGRPAKENTTFSAVDENFTAYGLITHRHTPEMRMHTGAEILFTPHLAPMNRGILATCYGESTGSVSSSADLLDSLADAFADEPFVIVSERIPETKAVMGSNCVHMTARLDVTTNTVISIVAIDNLVKGTAGQAIQCMNLMMGEPEGLGLPLAGVAP